MFKSHKKLTAAVLLSCACLMAPYYAHAAENSNLEEGDPMGPHTSTNIVNLDVNGQTFAKLDVYDTDSHKAGYYKGENTDPGQFRKFFADEEKILSTSMKYITDMVGNPSNTLNMNLMLYPEVDANASAMSDTLVQYDQNKKLIQISDSKLTAMYLGKTTYDDNEGVAQITVNMADQWYTEKFPVLPSNKADSDYYGTITHEMFHAMGLGTYVRGEDNIYHFGTDPNAADEDEEEPAAKLANNSLEGTDSEKEFPVVFNKYEMGLRDVFDRVAYYEVQDDGSKVYYDDAPINPNAADPLANVTGQLVSRQIVSINYDKFVNKEYTIDPDKFYVITNAPISSNCGVYFTGTNVQEVLNGAKIAWPDDASQSISPVPGLPINGYEEDRPELSHIELQNSLMSHQSYRNWCTYMEAEIALLQDLGYTIDRSKYFGKSIYNSGVKNEDNSIDYFTYTNNNAFNSDQMHGIGLHVYGSYVDVTQKADINAAGDYGIGIRVDGVGNKVTIDSNISANGEGGNGLLVAYGKEHEITLNAGKTIEATGTEGVAARFDFGSNELGDKAEYRGSYILTKYTSKEDIDEAAKDSNNAYEYMKIGWSPIEGNSLVDAIKGELVTNFNVAGTLKSEKNAIYIAPNALVKNINIMNGANIQGNIVSDWDPTKIIYDNDSTEEEADKPALMTLSSDAVDNNNSNVINSNVQESSNASNGGVPGFGDSVEEVIPPTDSAGSGDSGNNDSAGSGDSGNDDSAGSGDSGTGDPTESGGSGTTPPEYQYQNAHLKPALPDNENGFTNLTFGLKLVDGQPTGIDESFNMSYGGDILGANSIEMRVAGGTLNYSGTAEVLNVTIDKDAILGGTGTYTLSKITADTPVASTLDSSDGYTVTRGTFTNNGTFNLGDGIKEITITGNYKQSSTGNLGVDFNSDQQADKLIVNEGYAALDGTISLTPQVDYYFNEQKITIDVLDGTSISNSIIDSGNEVNVKFNNISPVLKFSLNTDETTQNTVNQGKYVINVSRVDQGYQSVADDKISTGIGSALDSDAKQNTEKVYVGADKLKLIQAIDFPLTTTNNPLERKKVMNSNIKKLNPNVVGSQAQAVLETHTTLNNLVAVTSLVNTGSMSMNVPTAVRRGGLGPTKVEPPKYNTWRNIVIPFAAYTNQHNGSNGYTNHNSGVIGAMERTFANGLTHGYHAAINHQSTKDSGSTIKGEGLYLGTHASYAPEEWNGWSVFGSARLGVEQMRSHRRVYISDSLAPYIGTADGDWTGYSGSFNIGAALTKEHGIMRSGPFAALDYSFAHRPSVHEDGGAVRTNLESATYDSLRTQLGYRLVTNPKALHSYDSTQWQAHASVAWNHELLSDNGRTNYQLVEFPGATVEDDIETYGRDSMSIAAGVIFKTPNRLDVGLTLGSDIYRHGGSSIYGKVNFEWKF